MKKIILSSLIIIALLAVPVSLVFAQATDPVIQAAGSNKYEIKSGEQMSLVFTVTGGVKPYEWLCFPALSGVSCQPSRDHTSVGIQGVPVATGPIAMSVTVKDGNGKTAKNDFNFTITGQAPVPPGTNPTPAGTPPPGGGQTTYTPPKALGASFYNPLGSVDNIPAFIVKITRILLTFTGMLSVLMIVIGGIRYVTSAGVSAQAEGAKRTITYAIIGLAVSILSFAIVQIVANTLVK